MAYCLAVPTRAMTMEFLASQQEIFAGWGL
jgi:hypothetical protein